MNRLTVITTVLLTPMAMDDKPSGNIFQMLADLITDELIFITLEMLLLQVIYSHFLPINSLITREHESEIPHGKWSITDASLEVLVITCTGIKSVRVAGAETRGIQFLRRLKGRMSCGSTYCLGVSPLKCQVLTCLTMCSSEKRDDGVAIIDLSRITVRRLCCQGCVF